MRLRTPALFSCLTLIPLATFLSGCSMVQTASPSANEGVVIKGMVHGGQQPVVGAHVYLMAAGVGGYGGASTSLLVAGTTGLSDSIGAYVLTAADGSFSITGDYTCTANTQVYLYALGGNPGAGVNSAAGFLAGLGNCPSTGSFVAQTPYVFMNEVSTIATAYSIAGYAVDATHVSSSGTPLAKIGIANAFLTVPNLETVATGTALTTTPALNGSVPQSAINTVANILAACVNSTGPGSTACTTLLTNAKSKGSTGTTATDTATVAINIAHNSGQNVATLYGLVPASPAFAPSLATAPNDFTLAINFSGLTSGANGPSSIAIDGSGNIWLTNSNGNTVSELSTTGSPLSPATGWAASGGFLAGIQIGLSESAWVADTFGNNLTELSYLGTPISPVGGFTGGGLAGPQGLSIDGVGNVWVLNYTTDSLSKFNGSGAALSPTTGFTGAGISKPASVAVDQIGNVWVANQAPTPGSLSKFGSTGAVISTTPFVGGGLNNPNSVAIDSNNNVWIANYLGSSISEFSNNGTAVSSSAGFTGGGLFRPYYISIDGGGNVWAANFSGNSVTELDNSGNPLSPSTGFAAGGPLYGPQAVESDGSGNVWIANGNNTTTNAVTELVGAAVPKVTPLAVALNAGTLGTRP